MGSIFGFNKNKDLLSAVWNDNLLALKNLLDSGADVNVKENNGATPLHFAAMKGHKEVAELLISQRADVNVRGNDGRTPLHLAAASLVG